jgi:hypothetical protein
MALTITKSSDTIRVDTLVMTLYAQPGGRKSSIGFTSEAPLNLDFDEGVYRAFNRGDSVICRSWADAAAITKDDLAPYKTLVVDTAGRALDKLAAFIIERDPKMGYAGALTLQGFGRLKAGFAAWLKMVRSFGLDVILLAHVDEQKNGDEIIERIDAQGASKNEIYKCSDAMGRLAIRNGKTMLMFSPTDTTFGKNPAQLEPLVVPMFNGPSTFLADVITKIKTHLNDMSAEQQELAALMTEWNERVQKATSAKKLTALIAESNELDERIKVNGKRLLVSWAKDHNFEYAGEKGFVEKPDVKKEAEKQEAVTA